MILSRSRSMLGFTRNLQKCSSKHTQNGRPQLVGLTPNARFSSYANPNPNPAMSDCYIQTCRIALLAGSCSGMVSRVRISVKAMVRD